MRRSIISVVALGACALVASPASASDDPWPLRGDAHAAASQYDRPTSEAGDREVAGSSATGASSSAGGTATAGVPGAVRGATVDDVVFLLPFGTTSDDLEDAIDQAVAEAGLRLRRVGDDRDGVREERFERFSRSALADRIGGGDDAELGRGVARALRAGGPTSVRIQRALAGEGEASDAPITKLLLTRSTDPSEDYDEFQHALASAFAADQQARPAYVERSDADRSFVRDFKRFGVPTVDNLDEPSGRAALAAILVRGAKGNFGNKPTADSRIDGGVVRVKPSAAVVTPGGDVGVTVGVPLLALTLVLLIGSWTAAGRRLVGRLRARR